jgi:hypothetical protein
MTRRLDAGPLLVTLGAVLLLASLFLDWYEGNLTAWSAFEVWDVVLLVLALGGIVLGVGLMVPDAETLDRRLLPAGVGAVAVIVASQIIDPPPAATGRDAVEGAWLALGSALVMCVGAVLTFGRVHLALTVEGRDARQHLSAVDARRAADQTTGSTPVVPEPAGGGAEAEAGGGRARRLFARAVAPPEETPGAVEADAGASAAGDDSAAAPEQADEAPAGGGNPRRRKKQE